MRQTELVPFVAFSGLSGIFSIFLIFYIFNKDKNRKNEFILLYYLTFNYQNKFAYVLQMCYFCIIKLKFIIMLFFRSTNDPEKDLKGGYSYHQSDLKAGTLDWLEDGETEKKFVANLFGCYEDEIEIAEDGFYVQALPGLCAYALNASTLEEALIELSELDIEHIDCINPENIYIFEGEEVASPFIVEGTLMNPKKILGKYAK